MCVCRSLIRMLVVQFIVRCLPFQYIQWIYCVLRFQFRVTIDDMANVFCIHSRLKWWYYFGIRKKDKKKLGTKKSVFIRFCSIFLAVFHRFEMRRHTYDIIAKQSMPFMTYTRRGSSIGGHRIICEVCACFSNYIRIVYESICCL